MPPFNPSRHRTTIALLITAILAAGACGGGGGTSETAGTSDTSDSGPADDAYSGAIDLKVGGSTVAAAGEGVSLDRAVARKVLATVDGYLDAAVVEPLLSGKRAKDLETHFGLRVFTRVRPDGADRAALTDEGLPDITADLETTADPVDLDALVATDGTVLMVGAHLSLHVRTETAYGPLSISRTGDLILEPTSEGKWQITGYDIEVRRRTAGDSTTTTASTRSAAA